MILLDLSGLAPAMAAEGDEAHILLQAFLSAIPGVECEVSIPNSSINGNVGFADIVYKHNGVVEIYEIKPGSYAPGAPNNISGKAQLQRYIDNYRKRDILFNGTVVKGTSLNPVIAITTLPGAIHPDKLIKYYVYPSDPGMIYWGYINNPQDENRRIAEKEKEEEDSDDNTIDEAVEDLGEVAISGLILFGLYEVIKWGAATLLAPETGVLVGRLQVVCHIERSLVGE